MSLPLRIAKWLGITWAVLFLTLLLGQLVTGLMNWNAQSVYVQPSPPAWVWIIGRPWMILLQLSFTLLPLVFVALFVWHWAQAMLDEQRRIRKALERLTAAREISDQHPR